jgi:hypothetical protein
MTVMVTNQMVKLIFRATAITAFGTQATDGFERSIDLQGYEKMSIW